MIIGFQVTVKNVGDVFFETQCNYLFSAKVTSSSSVQPVDFLFVLFVSVISELQDYAAGFLPMFVK